MRKTPVKTILKGSPYHPDYDLYNVVRIRMSGATLAEEYDAQLLMLAPKDTVILQDARGSVMATVVEYPHRKMVRRDSLRRILRLATEQDLEIHQENQQLEKEAFNFALTSIRNLGLVMKLVRVQWLHDRSRVVFYYTSPDRVDFRQLVKDLAKHLHTRIELHQIGIRDGTAMLGGLGSCGRELCCSNHIRNFGTVSITLAKEQGINLKPSKISGLCGRLMCCLVCEHHNYAEQLPSFPKVGSRVQVEEGSAIVLSHDLLHSSVVLRLDETGQRFVRALEHVDSTTNSNCRSCAADSSEDERYVWKQDTEIRLILT